MTGESNSDKIVIQRDENISSKPRCFNNSLKQVMCQHYEDYFYQEWKELATFVQTYDLIHKYHRISSMKNKFSSIQSIHLAQVVTTTQSYEK